MVASLCTTVVFAAALLPHPMKPFEVEKTKSNAKLFNILSPVSSQSSVVMCLSTVSLHAASSPQQRHGYSQALPWSWRRPRAAGLLRVGSPPGLCFVRWTQLGAPLRPRRRPSGRSLFPPLLVLLPLSLLMIKIISGVTPGPFDCFILELVYIMKPC